MNVKNIRGGIIKLTKRRKRKTKAVKKIENLSADVKIVVMIIISILLAVLIYTESGYIGQNLSPMLGGIFGIMKYILPIGTFGVAIYLACDDKKYINHKILQYVGVLLCLSAIFSIYQVSIGNIDINTEFGELLGKCYGLRRKKSWWRHSWNYSSFSIYKTNWNTWYCNIITWSWNYLYCSYFWF